LILVDPLLSPSDETALVTRLRMLPGAAEVGMLGNPPIAWTPDEGLATADRRWFYWFKQPVSVVTPRCEPITLEPQIETATARVSYKKTPSKVQHTVVTAAGSLGPVMRGHATRLARRVQTSSVALVRIGGRAVITWGVRCIHRLPFATRKTLGAV